ncbi:MAG: hypothetical protein KA954_01365 [Chitinophagales bacterium]|nr:hypothetical protein [Chitinophagales bacterium]MBP9845817.1 hypothetical protein [Saprospiraceae bacterium]
MKIYIFLSIAAIIFLSIAAIIFLLRHKIIAWLCDDINVPVKEDTDWQDAENAVSIDRNTVRKILEDMNRRNDINKVHKAIHSN